MRAKIEKDKNYFRKGGHNLDKHFKEKNRLQEIFLGKYKKPILVHSTPLKKDFVQILKDGKLRLPLDHGRKKKCPYMEKLLGIDNCIYFSLGFPYAARYEFKYSFIFDSKILRQLKYYSKTPVWMVYKRIVDTIYEEDPEYLNILKSKNKICEEIVNNYLHRKINGKVRSSFDFWKDEYAIFNWVQNYSNKKKINKIIKNTSKEFLVKYPISSKLAEKQCIERYVPEILSKKEFL